MTHAQILKNYGAKLNELMRSVDDIARFVNANFKFDNNKKIPLLKAEQALTNPFVVQRLGAVQHLIGQMAMYGTAISKLRKKRLKDSLVDCGFCGARRVLINQADGNQET